MTHELGRGQFRERFSEWEKRAWNILNGPLFKNKEGQTLTDEEISKLPGGSVDSLMHALGLRVYKSTPNSPSNGYIITIPRGFLRREERILNRIGNNHVIPVQEAIISLRKSLTSKQSPILPETVEIFDSQGKYEARARKIDGSFRTLFLNKSFSSQEKAEEEVRRVLKRLRQSTTPSHFSS